MTNILVVEDNAGLRRLIGIHLRRAGYEVSEAADGQAALDLLEHSRVHLIITDVMMPRLDGYGLIRELREAGDTTPVLMVTVKNSFDDMRTGFHAGADDYLTKPVNFEELLLLQNVFNMEACIAHCDPADEYVPATSRLFHARLGFEHAGRFNKCALKFGRWYDMIWMERILAKPAAQETSPFRPLPDIDQPYIDSILNRA